jgi:hypothetical protein
MFIASPGEEQDHEELVVRAAVDADRVRLAADDREAARS